MNRIILIITTLFLFGSFIVNDALHKEWPKNIKKIYMNACVDAASENMAKRKAKKYCACSMKKIMELFPDFTTLQNVDPKIIEKVAIECISK